MADIINPIKVLVADDHVVLVDGIKMLLQGADITVVGEAYNGRDAVRLACQLKPDVVLLDIGMPDLNGLDATAQIKEDTPETAVIILSMLVTIEHVYQALRTGAIGYLAKESAGREVEAAVRAAARGERYLSQRISDLLITDYLNLRESEKDTSPLNRLSQREREVLQLVVEGKNTAEISKRLALSPSTVDTYRSRLMTKLNLESLTDLVKFALQNGLTTL